MMFTSRFWKDATERAVKTSAQVVLTLGAGGALNILTIDWPAALGLAGGAALLSYATSVVSANATRSDSASLVSSEVKLHEPHDVFADEDEEL